MVDTYSEITTPTQVIDTIINFIPIKTGIATVTINTVTTNNITIRIQTIVNTIDINKAFMTVDRKNIKRELLN
jgi:hypothetical protein